MHIVMLNKKAASFGTIVAIFGSILIALGIAWLIAQNWHQINAAVKIIILLSATSCAYIAGSILRSRNYVGTGKSLLVLGALLYTLSIFLIAQIFHTSTTLQGIAWLMLLSWVGVFLTSYIFDSTVSLVIALVEIIVWLVMQIFAFFEIPRTEPYFGMLVLCFLAAGILFYGLYLLHRAKNHKFVVVYRWWTAFYLLAFTYILTFQSLLPSLWSNAQYLTSIVIFVILLFIAAIVLLVIGIISALEKKAVSSKELLGFVAVIVFLAVLIGLTGMVTNSIGVCFEKSCYDYEIKDNCEKAPSDMSCVWTDGFCQVKNCYMHKDQESCLTAPEKLKCEWGPTEEKAPGQVTIGCREKRCYDNKDKASCEQANCKWSNNYCEERGCYNYIDEPSCKNASKDLSCEWKRNFCDIKMPCEEFNNNYKTCSGQEKCKWQASYFGYYGQRNKVPLKLWAVWIFANLVFILFILGVIGYGTWSRIPVLINLGIIFFALDIITRYIGFIMDFWGYTSLSVFFITGGIILIFGGLFIEKWRRKLVSKTK